jgi:hypothetical protein
VAYLNGSKVLTTGSALTFDGTTLTNTRTGGGGVLLSVVSASGSPEVSITSADTGTSQINFGGATTPKKGVFRYSDNSDLFVWLLNSTAEQMRLTSTGLGIGTSSPGARLDIRATNPTQTIKAASTGFAYHYISNDGGDFYVGRDSSAGGAFGNANANVVWGVGANPILFATNNTVRATLDSSGNLGLGVPPSAWATLRGLQNGRANLVGYVSNAEGAWLTNNAFFDGSWKYQISAQATMYQQLSGVQSWHVAASGTAGNAISFTQAMTLDASGNLGVGTTSPSTRLHIAGATTATSQLTTQHTGSAVTTVFGCDGSIDVGAVYVTTNHPLAFRTNNTERARITSGGDLLVGKTTTDFGTNGVAFIAGAAMESVGSNNRIALKRTTDGNVIEFYQTVNVGSISITSTATAYNTSSDYRLKNTIAPMTGALAKVALLKPCTYKWNADGSDGEGFIAHELAEVVPQCVTGEKDAVDAEGKPQYQGIDTSFLVATLTAAIQELKAEFDAYKASHP